MDTFITICKTVLFIAILAWLGSIHPAILLIVGLIGVIIYGFDNPCKF